MNRRLHVLLPSRARAGIDPAAAAALVRGDDLPDAARGWLPALRELFRWPGTAFPAAALLREVAGGDAGEGTWICADPAWVEADINGARMMACGSLGLSREDAESLAAVLRPLLGDAGILLEVTSPDRWQARLSPGAPAAAFAGPEDVLGTNLLEWLDGDGEVRRWRRLFTEIQTELHEHPVNRRRRGEGLAPCNALWFWGGGRLPEWVRSDLDLVAGTDPLLQALAARAGVACSDPAEFLRGAGGEVREVLLDLGQASLDAEGWQDLLGLLRGGRTDELRLLFADGARHCLRRAHRWRFWRRAR